MALGVALLQGFGTYSFSVSDPQQFVTQIVGASGIYRTGDIQSRLRSMLLSKLQDLLGETTSAKSVPELIALTEEIGGGVRAKGQDDFKALGLTLKSFYIENLKPSDKSAEELRAMGMLDVTTYTQLQAADAMRDAAQNPSGGAGLTAGIGAGMGIGNVLGQTLQGMQLKGGRRAHPDVMTLRSRERHEGGGTMSGRHWPAIGEEIGKSFRISRDLIDRRADRRRSSSKREMRLGAPRYSQTSRPILREERPTP
jgi:membrane protease subunit (stomatin/prohibitin family)